MSMPSWKARCCVRVTGCESPRSSCRWLPTATSGRKLTRASWAISSRSKPMSPAPSSMKSESNPRPRSTQSYENYLKGRYYWNKRSQEGLTKAINYFHVAVEKDPRYALAYAGLADCYSIIGSAIVGTVPTAEVAPKARAAALKSLELDNTLAEAHTSLATVRFNYDWDWNSAASGFRRAVELNPSYATAYQRTSLYLMSIGRTSESIAAMNRRHDLDPLSISTNFSLGWRLYSARESDQTT